MSTPSRNRPGDPASGQPDAREPLPPLPPLETPMVPFAIAGSALWAVAGLVLLPFRDRLTANGHGSWLGICLAGFLLGLVGVATMVVHDRNRRRRAS